MVSGILVSDRILYCYLYRKLDQLYLGCGSRDVCAGMVIQYWNDSVEWRVSMVVFFFVNKIIFPEGEGK